MVKFIVFGFIVLISVYLTEQAHFLNKGYIKQINEKAKTWKAKENFPQNTDKKRIVRLLGSKISKRITNEPVKNSDPLYVEDNEIPETFDARKQWENCKTIGQVRDQGNCGSCWSHSTTSAFSDRLCIATGGKFNQLISAEELTFCCYRCGYGCNGGYPIRAWQFLKSQGVVTGGNYNTTDGCQPYKVPPCVKDDEGRDSCAGKPDELNHRCSRTCYGDKTINFQKDHHKTKDAYTLSDSAIQKDVIAHGPVEASIEIYDDFPSYASGVYQKTEDASFLGRHSIKLIGWGEENGVPYWQMVNSWGEQWGDKGMFKIARGVNECGVEESCSAGTPLV